MADIYDYLHELRKIEIEFQDENKIKHTLKSYIKSFDEDKILIDPPVFNGKNYNISTGQPIKIIVSTNGGAYIGDSSIVGKQLTGIVGLWISYPVNYGHVQRREYLRVPLNIETNLKIYINKEKTEKIEEKILMRDISGKGFSYVSEKPLNNYYEIECSFSLNKNEKEAMNLKCEHIYSKQAFIEKKPVYINSFAFIDIEPHDVDKIVKTCFKFQIDMKKKGLI